jgi:hypothetical protein
MLAVHPAEWFFEIEPDFGLNNGLLHARRELRL